MIKIKKIIFLILISSIFIEKGNTEINDALYMTIANRPITQSDIVNEIKILLILNKKDDVITKNIDSKSTMAFGAMGAHINMALQALKATEFDN